MDRANACLRSFSIFLLESCVGSVVGDTIETDLTDLTSGPGSFVFDASSLSAFVDGSFWIFVSAVTFSDERSQILLQPKSRRLHRILSGPLS
jgi:hypothetical protein